MVSRRRPAAPVGVVRLELDVVALLDGDELVGAGADWIQREFIEAGFLVILARNHEADRRREPEREDRIRGLGFEPNGIRAGDFDLLQHVEVALAVGLQRIGAPKPIGRKGKGHILGRHFLPVVKFYALADLDLPDGRLDARPRLRQARHQLGAVSFGRGTEVAADQVIKEDQFYSIEGVGDLARPEIFRQARNPDDEIGPLVGQGKAGARYRSPKDPKHESPRRAGYASSGCRRHVSWVRPSLSLCWIPSGGVFFAGYFRIVGSSRSRSQSPTMLIDKVVKKIAIPGNTAIHQATAR